eukprot:6322674-Amphidinium_carterae.1
MGREWVTIGVTIQLPWSQAEPCRPFPPSRSPSHDPANSFTQRLLVLLLLWLRSRSRSGSGLLL